MCTLSKELVFLILQFCNEECLKDTAHMLERESGLYFNMGYFEEMVLSGNWCEAERYLSGFTKLDDDRYSTKIYFELRKQAFFEALDSNDRAKALDILMKDLKVFQPGNEDLFKDMALLLTLKDIREHRSLSFYGDTKSAREIIMQELKKVIKAGPLFQDKLKFPRIKAQRLRRLINQGLNWQHILCEHPSPNPEIKTLFVDHVCLPHDDVSLAESSENSHPSEDTSSSVKCNSARDSTPSTITHQLGLQPVYLGVPINPAAEVHENSGISSDDFETSDEVTSTGSDPGQRHGLIVPARYVDVPRTVALTLNEGSSPTSMDFHPLKPTILLVGTSVGDVGIWDVSRGKKMHFTNFGVWNIEGCSLAFNAALVKNPNISVNCVMWSPDGSLFGVGYSKHLVHLYCYSGARDIQKSLEMDAHVGGVNDLAFSSPRGLLLVITCGDDKTIKAWDVATGNKQFTFEGHETPIYSLCPHIKENIPFLFSVSVDGKIKAWLYDTKGARVDYKAPGLGCARMAYSADGQRLFSCGTNKDGQTSLVEWNESEGSIKRIYQGLCTCLSSVVQFGTIKNQLLAAGDDHVIKFWDMNNNQLLGAVDVDGELPVTPLICFNKEGTLLAVVANENRIKILATDNGLHLLQTTEKLPASASREMSKALEKIATHRTSTDSDVEFTKCCTAKNGEQKEVISAKSLLAGEANAKENVLNLFVFDKPSQFHSLKLSDGRADKISKLMFTNSGNAILALASNGNHLLWKWPSDKFNSTGKATTKVHPQLWQRRSGIELMSNGVCGSDPKKAVPCFALSKTDSYLLSASGGIISLFNMLTFKTMSTMLPPPPAATSLAFYPQDNNIVAIGTDDSTIFIYNARWKKLIAKLEGHTKRVTGLAFSSTQMLLISSGADQQIFAWSIDEWKKQKSTLLQSPCGPEFSKAESDTHIQIHQDQLHFLVVHKTHLAIYEAKDLECDNQWNVSEAASLISHATFSCDSQTIYASFLDGTIAMFDASTLQLQCQIYPYAYLPFTTRVSWSDYPVVIAAHPQKPAQLAVGLGNGEVYVLEPPENQAKWGCYGSSVDDKSWTVF